MEINDEHTKKLYKEQLLNKIRKISEIQSKFIMDIENLEKYLRLGTNLSNTGTLLNNKLIEIEHEFEKSGLSMYSVEIEKDFSSINPTFIGKAIILDLIDYAKKGTLNLFHCSNIIHDITDEKTKGLKKIQSNPFRRFFAQIRNRFVLGQQNHIGIYTEEEMNIIKSAISKYKDINDQLWKYNLRDNIVSSITKTIRQQKYKAFMVPSLLVDTVNPDLQKLGLVDLIPELQSTLMEEYKKDLPDSEIYQINEEYMHLYVPDFDREIKSKEEILEMTPEERVNEIQAIIYEGEGTSLRKDGATLGDFSSIDATVSVSDRQTATSIIDEELALEEEQNRRGEEEKIIKNQKQMICHYSTKEEWI